MPSLPNALSIFRLVAAPLLLLAAWHGQRHLFWVLFLAALLSDALDGFLARRLGQVTPLGGLLDSWGDFVLACATLPALWWLWPRVVLAELPYMTTALLALLLPVAIGFLKFGRLTSYHTWGAKAAAVALAIAIPLLLVGGPAWPFRLAVFLLAASAMEEVAITIRLQRWQADIPSCLHPWRHREEK